MERRNKEQGAKQVRESLLERLFHFEALLSDSVARGKR